MAGYQKEILPSSMVAYSKIYCYNINMYVRCDDRLSHQLLQHAPSVYTNDNWL